MLRVAVGSKNPVKVDAVKEVFENILGQVEVIAIEVGSGVSRQPINEEAVQGAKNRALGAIKKAKADFGVGIEGGLVEFNGKSYFMGFCAVINKDGNIGTGTSGWFECPPAMLDRIKNREELGDLIDELTGRRDIKKKEGAIGIFTKGNVTRKDLYKHGLYMALVRYMNKELFYEKPERR